MYDFHKIEEEDVRYTDITVLYRYFDEDGGLLYVGISNDVAFRDSQHFKKSEWRMIAKYIRTEIFPSRRLAEAAEEFAIHDEDPMGNSRRRKPCEFFSVPHMWYIEKHGGKLVGERPLWAAVEPSGSGVWNMMTICDHPW